MSHCQIGLKRFLQTGVGGSTTASGTGQMKNEFGSNTGKELPGALGGAQFRLFPAQAGGLKMRRLSMVETDDMSAQLQKVSDECPPQETCGPANEDRLVSIGVL